MTDDNRIEGGLGGLDDDDFGSGGVIDSDAGGGGGGAEDDADTASGGDGGDSGTDNRIEGGLGGLDDDDFGSGGVIDSDAGGGGGGAEDDADTASGGDGGDSGTDNRIDLGDAEFDDSGTIVDGSGGDVTPTDGNASTADSGDRTEPQSPGEQEQAQSPDTDNSQSEQSGETGLGGVDETTSFAETRVDDLDNLEFDAEGTVVIDPDARETEGIEENVLDPDPGTDVSITREERAAIRLENELTANSNLSSQDVDVLQRGDGTLVARPSAELAESQRQKVADQLGVDPSGVRVEVADNFGVDAELSTSGQRSVAEDIASETEQLSPEDLEVTETGGVSLTDRAQQEAAREQFTETAQAQQDTQRAQDAASPISPDEVLADEFAPESRSGSLLPPQAQFSAEGGDEVKAETGETEFDTALADLEGETGVDLPGPGEGDTPDVVQLAEQFLQTQAQTQREGDGLLPSPSQAGERSSSPPEVPTAFTAGAGAASLPSEVRRGIGRTVGQINPAAIALSAGQLTEAAGETVFDAATVRESGATLARTSVPAETEEDVETAGRVGSSIVKETEEGIEERPLQTAGSAVGIAGLTAASAGAGSAATTGARRTVRAARRAELGLDEFRAANRGMAGGGRTITREATDSADATDDILDDLPPKEAFNSAEEFRNARLRRRAKQQLNERAPPGETAEDLIPQEQLMEEIEKRAARIELDERAPAGEKARDLLSDEQLRRETQRVAEERFGTEFGDDVARATADTAEETATAETVAATAAAGAGQASAEASGQQSRASDSPEATPAPAPLGSEEALEPQPTPTEEIATPEAMPVADDVEQIAGAQEAGLQSVSDVEVGLGLEEEIGQDLTVDFEVGQEVETDREQTEALELSQEQAQTREQTRTVTREATQEQQRSARQLLRTEVAEPRTRPRVGSDEMEDEDESAGLELPITGVRETEFAFEQEPAVEDTFEQPDLVGDGQ